MARVTIQLDDDIAAAVKALGQGSGLSQSAWIKHAIASQLRASGEAVRAVPFDDGAAKGGVRVRLPLDEIAAIQRVSGGMGLTSADWIRTAIRWQLWTAAGELRLSPATTKPILRLVGQVRAIGYSLNQAVKAMNAANRPGSTIAIERIGESVVAMRADLNATIAGTVKSVTDIARGEVSYWTQQHRRWKPGKGRGK